MKAKLIKKHNSTGTEFFKRCCYGLLILEVLLGIAHLLWPEYRWGQGRYSYFNFDNSLTLASWLAGMQLAGVAILALIGFHRARHQRDSQISQTAWPWLLVVLAALVLSVAEITRFHRRLELLGYPNPDVYEQFVIVALGLGLLALFGWFLLDKLRNAPNLYRYGVGWLIAWGLELFLITLSNSPSLVPGSWDPEFTLAIGLAYLSGCTLLLTALGGYVLRPNVEIQAPATTLRKSRVAPFPEGSHRIWILLGVGGMSFAIIFLQIILFRMLTIFGDYLTANSVISIALLGISFGGLIGWRTSLQAPLQTMVGASLLLPVSILLAFGTAVSLTDTPLLASILLMLPFVCSSTVITIALARTRSYLVYAIDLLGAAIGALLVGVALSRFREEGSLLFLGALTFLVSGCFIILLPARRVRIGLICLMYAGVLSFWVVGRLNLHFDWLNIVQTKIQKSYPRAEVLFSRSSFVGRYDVIRRKPTHTTLKTLENGRVIDTLRRNPTEDYQIDPRIPHTLIEDPVILIIGLSGDGISKTAKALGKKVYGVEINPAIVSLQTNELVEFNANSYENIEVAVMDGRSFVQQSDELYDIITLMNTHTARGRTTGRAASPEYLHTREAMASYLKHLTERGVLIVEEPVSQPRREPPVWKLLMTMRQALIDQGSTQLEQHFFIFQWRTKRDNYIQILMKKNPLTDQEVANLRTWVQDVDDIKAIEASIGRRIGLIRTAKTTILHSPDEYSSTNYSRILRGEVDEDFVRTRNLYVTTDDRPFHFDVDPAHPEMKGTYVRTLLMAALLIPFFLSFLARYRSELRNAVPYMLIVALTGMGFLLTEVVLIQRYEVFLGSPVVTFATILGALLIFSGLGSLWSGRIGQLEVYGTLGGILLLLMVHQWWVPSLFPMGVSLPLYWKVALAVASLAPLGFFMGVPFPYVLRLGKAQFAESAAGILFAISAATSALAVPLAMNISTSYGLNATFQIGVMVYLVVGILLVAMEKQRVQVLAYRFAMLAFCLLLIWPWMFAQPAFGMAGAPDRYRVYGVSYGHSSYREDKIIHGGSSSESMPFEWLFWIIKGNGRTILVDTGFEDPEIADDWDISDYVRPAERLSQLGISPSEVSDVILTHAHWDHMGGLAPYENAKIWIQEEEYQYARSIISVENPQLKGMRWQDLEILIWAEKQGRLKLVRGEEMLAPGITMTLGGYHTPGSQYVVVETLDGPVIIAGDNTYMYENNRRHKPIGSRVDHDANLATIREMHRRAASPFLILPGHDPLVMRWFPEVSEGIVQITTVPE
ncbi:MAG: MBL fold metallo-hydrolase [Anaerolineae bacterium]